jgi:hypothetical protein
MVGKMGEDGSLKLLGKREELNTRVLADGGDGGSDAMYNGNTFDVKTAKRSRTRPALTVDAGEPLGADHYVLASRIGPTDVRLIGYAPRWVVANAEQRSYQGDDYHFVPQRDLIPFPDVSL